MEGGGGKSGPCPGHCGAAVMALITSDLAGDQLALPTPGLRRKLWSCPSSCPVPRHQGHACVHVSVRVYMYAYRLQPPVSPLRFPGWS